MKRLSWLLFIGLALSLAAETRSVEIGRWLALGPLDIPASEVQALAGDDALLDHPFLDMASLRPEPGRQVEWVLGDRRAWTRTERFAFTAGPRPQVVYWAAYLETARWLQSELIVEDAPPLRLYLDGKRIKSETAGGKASCPLVLTNGKHLLVGLFLLRDPGTRTFRPRWFLQNKDPFVAAAVDLSFTPERRTAVGDVLGIKNVNDLAVSPDGELVAVFFSQQAEDEKAPRRWMEIMGTRDGRSVFSMADAGAAATFAWMKDSRSFAFARSDNDRTSIHVYSLADHQQKTVCRGIERFSGCWWAAGGQFLVFGQYHEGEAKGYKFVRDLPDRAAEPRRRQSLTLLYPASGVRHLLAGEKENQEQVVIAPDGSRIVLVKEEEDPRHRPYSSRVFTLVNVATLGREKLLEDPWLGSVSWSPDSRQLLFLGGPSAFGGLGRSLPETLTPNEYDVQAYLFDLTSRKPQALTRLFSPSIDAAFWSPADRQIYFKVTDHDYGRIYCYSPDKRTFQMLAAPVGALARVSFSNRRTAVFWGSGPANPPKLYVADLGSFSCRMLTDVNRDLLADVRWGRVENVAIRIAPKKQVLGMLYYPADFNAAGKYPCIVNYYGGTTPVGRDYGGRYPKEWYAANGYFVLVLQPSGAIGFGQENSALHVNDWGEITAAEIIAAVQEFLPSRPYIDVQRLGAIGASYGGFLTQYLATRTDLFAAYVSHAGISSLASYWGVGDWGVSYSAFATADSFPWNRKDIYVGHSPLFLAERIKRPLLLLHGEADNNVPPGESYQMYAALKLQGKEVALVTFAGQQHFILEPEKRRRWMATIIAWFDRWLKGQPEWWENLYPEKE